MKATGLVLFLGLSSMGQCESCVANWLQTAPPRARTTSGTYHAADEGDFLVWRDIEYANACSHAR